MGRGRIVFGILIVLLLFGLIAGVGVTAYNAGVTRGMLTPMGALPAAPNGTVMPPAPYYAPYMFWRPFGWGLGFLGCLVPFFVVLLLFALFRLAFGGPHWRRGYGMHAFHNWDSSQRDVPPVVQEWHRKLHEQEGTASASASTKTEM
jgi:hypothetical protein